MYTTPALILPSSSSLPFRYQPIELRGAGGFCQVYKALDLITERIVAVKHLHQQLSPEMQTIGTASLRHEAHVLRLIAHQAIPRLLDYDESSELLVMDYIDGVSLQEALPWHNSTALPLTDIAELGLALCAILQELHRQGIVWCDLTANNVLLDHLGQLFLIDAGSAAIQGERPMELYGIGTINYSAPELYPDAEMSISPATDLYSLGTLLHAMITLSDPRYSILPPLPLWVPPLLAECIWCLRSACPEERPQLSEVIPILQQQRR